MADGADVSSSSTTGSRLGAEVDSTNLVVTNRRARKAPDRTLSSRAAAPGATKPQKRRKRPPSRRQTDQSDAAQQQQQQLAAAEAASAGLSSLIEKAEAVAAAAADPATAAVNLLLQNGRFTDPRGQPKIEHVRLAMKKTGAACTTRNIQ